jgi:hypothetical protein
MNGLMATVKKLQEDMNAIKDKWGDGGSKKSFPKFEGGDRTASFIFSIKQNR